MKGVNSKQWDIQELQQSNEITQKYQRRIKRKQKRRRRRKRRRKHRGKLKEARESNKGSSR
jgi:hypothetical protein